MSHAQAHHGHGSIALVIQGRALVAGQDWVALTELRPLEWAPTPAPLHIGDWLIHHGRRQELAPLDKADYGLFRVGRDYVQRCRTLGQPIPVGFTVRHRA